jgi:hypothetical protein
MENSIQHIWHTRDICTQFTCAGHVLHSYYIEYWARATWLSNGRPRPRRGPDSSAGSLHMQFSAGTAPSDVVSAQKKTIGRPAVDV